MQQDRGEVLHSLLHLVTSIQDGSSVGICPGPALMHRLPGREQADVLGWCKELAEMELVEFPSINSATGLFLVRVTPAGKQALASAPGSSFWKRREVSAESGKLGRDPNVLLHQTITMEQVLLALRAGLEQAGLSDELRDLLAQAQDACQRSTDAGAGPSLAQWARRNPDRLAVWLRSLASTPPEGFP